MSIKDLRELISFIIDKEGYCSKELLIEYVEFYLSNMRDMGYVSGARLEEDKSIMHDIINNMF